VRAVLEATDLGSGYRRLGAHGASIGIMRSAPAVQRTGGRRREEEAGVMRSTTRFFALAIAGLVAVELGRLVWDRLAARSERGYQQWRERWH
jgi:hypothetical protein